MLITTTHSVQGYPVVEYRGLVSGEAIIGTNVFRDFFAGITDLIGGRSAAYEEKLREAKRIAVDEMSEQARQMGANAVVAVDLDYETIDLGGNNGGMLMVTASGTAVVLGQGYGPQAGQEPYTAR